MIVNDNVAHFHPKDLVILLCNVSESQREQTQTTPNQSYNCRTRHMLWIYTDESGLVKGIMSAMTLVQSMHTLCPFFYSILYLISCQKIIKLCILPLRYIYI